jgi:hypothetical protein
MTLQTGHELDLLNTIVTATIAKTELRGLSPRASYTDRETAACRRSKCQPLRMDWGCLVVSATDPHGSIFGFLDRSRYFFFQVAPQLYSRGWVDHASDPLLLGKSGNAGNRIRDLWICSQELWPIDHRGGPTTIIAISLMHTHTLQFTTARMKSSEIPTNLSASVLMFFPTGDRPTANFSNCLIPRLEAVSRHCPSLLTWLNSVLVLFITSGEDRTGNTVPLMLFKGCCLATAAL